MFPQRFLHVSPLHKKQKKKYLTLSKGLDTSLVIVQMALLSGF